MLIERAGDVIPRVVRVLLERRPPGAPSRYAFPAACPACGSAVVAARGRSRRAVHERRAARPGSGRRSSTTARAARWTSSTWARRSSSSSSAGGSSASFADLYRLSVGQLVRARAPGREVGDQPRPGDRRPRRPGAWPGCSTRSASGTSASGPRASSPSTSGRWTACAAAGEDDIGEIHGIGPRIAQAVRLFLDQAENQRVIDQLAEVGVVMEEAGAAQDPSRSPGRRSC